MNDVFTTHMFKSAEMKKKMQETMGSITPEDIVKSTTCLLYTSPSPRD